MSISAIRRAGAAAAVAAVGATAAFVGSPASAQTPCYPPTPGCFITTTSTTTPGSGLTLALSDSTDLLRGQTIQATATGFDAGTSGTFSIASVEQQIGTFTVSAARVGTSSVTIPANIELGAHTIFARGTLNGTSASVSRSVNVVAATTTRGGGGGGGGTLARTGVTVGATALVGLGLVAGGAALKRSSKRGKSSTTV